MFIYPDVCICTRLKLISGIVSTGPGVTRDFELSGSKCAGHLIWIF